jgi:hypothetical protein
VCERGFIDNHKVTEKVGKHNALSGDTAPGRTGSSIDGEYSTPIMICVVTLGTQSSNFYTAVDTPAEAACVPLRRYVP